MMKSNLSMMVVCMALGACATGNGDKMAAAPGATLCEDPRPQVCTMDYRPVCGTLKDGSSKTYSNGCGACADACPQSLFAGRNQAPWRHRVAIGSDCLAHRGVVCESCRDGCETRAIRFTPALGRAPTPELALDRCTGCGACVGVCPAGAITWIANPPAGGSSHDVG